MATVAAGAAEEARRAVEAAQPAFAGWAEALPVERQRVLLRAGDILDRRREEVIGLRTRETGCGHHYATVQVDFSVSLLRQSAGLPYTSVGQVLPLDLPTPGRSRSVSRSVWSRPSLHGVRPPCARTEPSDRRHRRPRE